MNSIIGICLFACAFGVGLTLYADHSRQPRWEWLGKPLAALAFIAAGYFWGAADTAYGQLILAGLIFGALGDVLLIPRSTGLSFVGGMLAFALGHLFYLLAFARLPLALPALAVAALGMLLFSSVILRWLLPHVPAPLKLPVLGYLLIIGGMVVLALGAAAAGASVWIAVGAVAFAVSDLAVARERFVAPGLGSRNWGLPLYFAAQMLLAFSVTLV